MPVAGVKSILRGVVDLFVPRKCRICGRLLTDNESHVCAGCMPRLERTGYAMLDFSPLEQRFTGCKGTLVKAVSPFFFEKDGAVAHLIHALKYGGVKGLGIWLGRLVASELYPAGWFADAEMLVPVPLHRIKQWQRGFNQSLEICKGISEVTGIPVIDCIKMQNYQDAQARKNRNERWARRQGVYALKPEMQTRVQNRHLVVVDDVCTTGATLQAIVQMLSAYPGIKVSLLTVAVAH